MGMRAATRGSRFEEKRMTDTTLPTVPAKRMLSPAALLGAGVLVASLGAAAGWMIHASRPAADADAAKLALAPNESVVTPAQQQPVPQVPTAAPQLPQAPQAAAVQTPPVQSAPPQHSARRQPAARHSAPGTAAGSGTSAATGTTPLATQRAATCDNCGVIEGVRSFQRKGEGSGLGAVAGGVLGGVLGHQVGKGHGRDAMTVIGAVGGGIAGNEVEKRMKAETLYEVRVRMDDGSVRTFTQRSAPTPGARVVVEGNSFRTVSSQGGEPAGGNMVRTSAQGA
jgi:outer membrane lipoprotein SlyB